MDEFEINQRTMTRIDEPRHFLLRLAESGNKAKTNDGEAKNLLGNPKGRAPLAAGGIEFTLADGLKGGLR